MLRRLLLVTVLVPCLCFCSIGVALMPRIARILAEENRNTAATLVDQAEADQARAAEVGSGNVDTLVNDLVTARRQESSTYQSLLWLLVIGVMLGGTLISGAILYRSLRGRLNTVNAEFQYAWREYTAYRGSIPHEPPAARQSVGPRPENLGRPAPRPERYRIMK